MTFGQYMRRLRLESGMTQVELGESAGLTQSFIGKLERGEHAPEPRVIRRLIISLHVKDVGRFVRLGVLAGVPIDLRTYCERLNK